ncbi:MAG TPA: adenylate/guanylate cyclase domain-containing protein [Nordella sp.]|nr:adenylate/guanylate cyclase domain-containing protein [Nordella sp.]
MAVDHAISETLMDEVSAWLKQASLRSTDLETVIRGCCERLAATGVPLKRINISLSILHPLYRAMGFTWRRGEGLKVEGYRHVEPGQEKDDQLAKSPYYQLINNGLEHMRRRIDVDGTPEFPIFEDFKKEGITDYLAFFLPFGEDSGQGIVGSWSTDRPGGFNESEISALLRIQGRLAVAARVAVLSQLAGNMLTTYLGTGAGKRVLSGQIQRGDGETIRAALIMADMRNSTAIAEQAGRQVFIDTLNQFFDAIAVPFSEGGAEILSFLGDGFLAVIPCARHRGPSEIACREALAAAHNAVARMTQLNERRKSEELPEIGYGLGLHVGNVMFGNVGLKERLTFSAFGQAVNEVQRLEGLSKKYKTPIIASDEFALYSGGEWNMLGVETLRGTEYDMKVHAPFAGTGKISDYVPASKARELTDAERLILLHRDNVVPARRKAS